MLPRRLQAAVHVALVVSSSEVAQLFGPQLRALLEGGRVQLCIATLVRYGLQPATACTLHATARAKPTLHIPALGAPQPVAARRPGRPQVPDP
jgi:hypothetical protein